MQYDSITLFTIFVHALHKALSICIFSTPKLFVSLSSDNQTMTNNGKEYPGFFKVFLKEKHSERMLIPNAFVSLVHSKRRVIKDFILKDRRGRDWYVKACRIGDEFYFDDGWKQFSEENCLVENDFLVFTHIENNVFKFKILELSSMCEKMPVMDEEENNNNMMEDEEEEENGDDGDDDDDDDDAEEGVNDDDTMVDEQKDDGDDDDAGDDDGSENIMKEEQSENVYKEIKKSGNQHCRTCKAWHIGSSSAGSNLEDDEIDAEMYIQPGNPHFFAKHSHYRPNELHFPKNVIKDFCVCFRKYINLVCCHCKDIKSNEIEAYHHILPQISTRHTEKRGEIRTWKNGRVLVLGWEDFCRKCKITENDRCLCELVLRNGEAIEMIRVHIVRKVNKK